MGRGFSRLPRLHQLFVQEGALGNVQKRLEKIDGFIQYERYWGRGYFHILYTKLPKIQK